MDVNNDHIERQKVYICVCGQGFSSSQFSIQCDHCKEWFHGFCVQLQEFEAEEVDKFYCNQCQKNNPDLKTISKPVTNNWRHNRTEVNADGKPVQTGTSLFIEQLKNKTIKDAKTDETVIKRMRGQQLTFKELLINGFNIPILVESKDGLELTVPSNGFSAKSLLDYYSSDHVLDVIDVRRQLNIKMKIQDFIDKLSVPPEHRPDIYNCISLEVSNNPLSNSIRPPNIVNKLSWVENYWPPVESKPSVSKYCLLSMRDSYTDFHIDFGGTSVWYHVLSGGKIFFIIKPTKENLELYEKWMSSDQTSDKFFADFEGIDQCYRLDLFPGNTLFIPTGWIHAVFTPQDSVVFGGNFLHSLNIELQIKVREMEQRLKTPFKFQFPFFEMTHWYAAPNVQKLLEDNLKQKPPKHLVDGVAALIPQLRKWLNKSKEFQNQNDFQISSLAPKGFNCNKLLKDLNSSLKKALRKLDGQPITKKRGKPYKDFDLKDKEESIGLLKIVDSLPENQTIIKESDKDNGESMATEDKDQTLMIDDSSKVPKIRSLSTESESKGSLKLKLSISGAKEILGSSCDDNQNLCSDLNDISFESQLHSSPRFENENDSNSPKRQKKRKRNSKDEHSDDEIASMVKGLAEDDNFIYFDLETPADEEEMARSKSAPKDEPWAPKAKVTIKGTPKAPRQPREEAKRLVVETTIANAAARMESLPQPKRQYVKKKAKSSVSKQSSSESNTAIDSVASIASDTKVSSSVTAPVTGPSNLQSNANRMQMKAKKGLKTPKQRLHKIICQKKRGHF